MERYSLILILLLIASVSSFKITPLRAGTIELNDTDIRSKKKITSYIDLKMDK